MAMTKCVECGKEISSSAKVCPHCGKKEPTTTTGIKVISFLILLVLIYFAYNHFFKSDHNPTQTISEQPSITYPSDQLSFHAINADYPQQYSTAKNEILKSAVFNACNQARYIFFKQLEFRITDWVGKISDITTDQGGHVAYLGIVSDANEFKIAYETYNNSFSDIGTNSMLKKGTKVYDQVANLKIGDNVSFSGKVVPDKERGIREASLTEQGCVDEPEFIILFQNVVSY